MSHIVLFLMHVMRMAPMWYVGYRITTGAHYLKNAASATLYALPSYRPLVSVGLSLLITTQLVGLDNIKFSPLQSDNKKMSIELEHAFLNTKSLFLSLNESTFDSQHSEGILVGLRHFYAPSRSGWFSGAGLQLRPSDATNSLFIESGLTNYFTQHQFIQLNYQIAFTNAEPSPTLNPSYTFYYGYKFKPHKKINIGPKRAISTRRLL